MGRGYYLKCWRCGYEFRPNVGIGFLYPSEYLKNVESARKGEYGEKVKRFLEEYPDGALDCEHVVLQCKDCGALREGIDLTMYYRDDDTPLTTKGIFSVACSYPETSYVVPSELKEYKLYGKYDHRCDKCGGKMRVYRETGFYRKVRRAMLDDVPTPVPCPECGKEMRLDKVWMWD